MCVQVCLCDVYGMWVGVHMCVCVGACVEASQQREVPFLISQALSIPLFFPSLVLTK